MRYKRILVPFDGSTHSESALNAACDLLRDGDDAELFVLTVIMAPSVAPGGRRNPLMTANTPVALMNMDDYSAVIAQALDDERAKIAEKLVPQMEEFGDRVHPAAAANLYTVDGINEFVDENDIDLIVMGRRGLGALRGMLGSVSFGVLRSSEVPVLCVK